MFCALKGHKTTSCLESRSWCRVPIPRTELLCSYLIGGHKDQLPAGRAALPRQQLLRRNLFPGQIRVLPSIEIAASIAVFKVIALLYVEMSKILVIVTH